MAVGYNPRIVTDGLVFCVDVANVKSYPGSGTDLYDLSGNGYNGTMTDVTITSDGHMSFDGQNPGSAVAFPESNISKDPSLYLGGSSGRFTYECWVNKQGDNHNASSQARIMSTDLSDYNGIAWYHSSHANHANKIIFFSLIFFLFFFLFLFSLFFFSFLRQNDPATAAPLQEGGFWKRSETKKRTPLIMSLLLLYVFLPF